MMDYYITNALHSAGENRFGVISRPENVEAWGTKEHNSNQNLDNTATQSVDL